MSDPAVSVIMPVRNGSEFLAEALESLRNQTLESWECLIVDDGSTDRTAEIAEEFARRDPRFRVFRLPPQGVSRARNRAISESRGRYIQFLDADDELLPAKLGDQAAILDGDNAIDVVLAPVVYCRDGIAMHTDERRFAGQGAEILRLLSLGSPAMAAPFVRRSAIDRSSLFPEGLSRHEDWFFWIALAASGARFSHHPENVTARVRWHAGNVTRNQAAMEAALSDLLPLLDGLHTSSTAEANALRSLSARLRARLAILSRGEGGPRGAAVRDLVAGAFRGVSWRERGRNGLLATFALVLPARAFRILAGRSLSRLLFQRIRR